MTEPARARARAAATATTILLTLAYAFAIADPLPVAGMALVLDLALLAAALSAALSALLASRGSRGRDRLGWAILAAATLSWCVGQAGWVFDAYVRGRGEELFTPTSVGYLLFAPVASAGLLALVAGRHGNLGRLNAALQAVTVAGALFFVAWTLGGEALFGDPQESPALRLAAIVYPLADVGLATLAFVLASRAQAGHRTPWIVLGAGALLIGSTDAAFTTLVATGDPDLESAIALGWLTGFALLALAPAFALALPEPAERRWGGLTPSGIALSSAPLVVAAVVALASLAAGRALDALQSTVGAAMVIVVALSNAVSLLENRALRQEVERRLADLETASEQRTQLVNAISHDLLNPLTPIAVQVHLLRASPTLGAKDARALDVIERNATHMQRLIVDLKDLAKLQSGALALKPAPADLRELASFAAQSFAETAKGKGVALDTRFDGPLPVVADAGRIGQVFLNLLSNAVKFTPAGGSIVVEAGREDGCAIVRVRDSGRGLAADEIPRLFKPFSQVHAAGETSEKGTGLGLYISRGIAEQHGGSLTVESAGHGRGSTFTLGVPLAS